MDIHQSNRKICENIGIKLNQLSEMGHNLKKENHGNKLLVDENVFKKY